MRADSLLIARGARAGPRAGLVVNKVDRLCAELGLSPDEAYVRIRGLVESVDAVCANMVQTRALEDREREMEEEGSH